ncbi:MAG: ChbG/HpnK family deacetylase [Deltaproteobacteria bacterium]|nr:ChbG/HpnK family deacetylase [Deltaproteobacteria bacterium]
MKHLIVNADDYNTDRERNRGILQAAQDGIVTSVTVITNLVWDDAVLSDLKTVFDLRVGIHLNLTKGIPITKDTESLVNKNGRFFEKREAWWEAGITPDHIDGNNHIHIFPEIIMVVARLANDFGISKIRVPYESFWNASYYFRSAMVKKQLIGNISKKARLVFKEHGLRFPDCFAGIQFPRVSSVESLKLFIKNLPEGITELMCHPGYAIPSGSGFSTVAREQELFALTNLSVLQDVRDRNVNLISYSDI